MMKMSSKIAKTLTKSSSPKSETDLLWSLLPHPKGSVVRVFTRGDQVDGDFARSALEVRRFARSYSGQNIYVAPNPTSVTGGIRHRATDVTHWSYFLVDIDPVEDKADPEAAMRDALGWLSFWLGPRFDRFPPIIIDSGRGMQAWFRLRDLVLDDTVPPGKIVNHTVSRNTARRINGYWLKKLDKEMGVAHGCRVDTSVSDLPRVMRCPGTINVKTGRMSRILIPSTLCYEYLAESLSCIPKEAVEDPPVPDGVPSGLSWQEVMPHLTKMAQDYLLRGQEEPGRHKVMWHTAKKLQELGVTRREAQKALRWANSLRGKDQELPPEQLAHAIVTAYGE